MKKVIEKIYLAETSTTDIEETADYKKYYENFNKLYDEFDKTLNKSQRKLFKELIDVQCDLQAEELRTFFQDAFRLGLRLGFEVFGE